MILSCRDVTVAYDSKIAVDHVSFEVNEGEYVCIVGENGSGKSTLLKSILGLVPLKCGSVSFGPEVHRKRLGYLPQQTNIQKDFPASVYEVVLSGCLNRRGLKPFYSKEDKEQAMQHMERLGIGNFKKRSFSALSGGQQQRVLLARALCATDKLLLLDELLLDEPTNHLDVESIEWLEAYLKSYPHAIIMVSHDISSAIQYADKILHINQSLLFYGDTESYINTELGKRFLKCS